MAKTRTTSPLDAEIIAIGTELLIGGRSDFNSLFLADELGKIGIAVRFKSVVGDERQDIVTAIHTAVKRAQVIVMTGGLGPTVDDAPQPTCRPESLGGVPMNLCAPHRHASTRTLFSCQRTTRPSSLS